MLGRTLWLALMCAGSAAAQTAPPPAPSTSAPAAAPELRARLDALVALLSGKGDYESLFAPTFRTAVPRPKFDELVAQLIASYGPVTGISHLRTISPWSAEFDIEFAQASGSAKIAIDSAPPHQVTELRLAGFTSNQSTLASTIDALSGLHGTTGFAFARLGNGGPVLLATQHADRPYAIGSAFKLIILAELVRATNAGERNWDDLVTLDGAELPAGGYNLKPKGTQVSLRELATQMISISDNSATDILLKALGREKVEAMLPVVGAADSARNRPFLSTMELFKLKGIEANDLAGRYLAQDEAGRRRMLDSEVASLPALLIRPTLFRDGKPVRIEQLEWFLSPADLVRVMDWLRRNTEGPSGADARAILSKNPGIAPGAAEKWQWVGYKGGSEPGVMNMTLLLQAGSGEWYALAASWNDPDEAVSEPRFAALVSRAAELAAPR